jgi:hypothetical protein
MTVLLYAKAGDPCRDDLRQRIQVGVPGIEVEACEIPGNLSRRLSDPGQNPSLVILLFENRGELAEILPVRHWFQDISIILIVPDRTPETIALAHQLRPRFLAYRQDDFGTVAAVVGKMLKIPAEGPPL